MKKLFGFLMVGLAFTALQVAMVADAHAFSPKQGIGQGLKFGDLVGATATISGGSEAACAKTEDTEDFIKCRARNDRRPQVRAAYDACIRDAPGCQGSRTMQ